MQWFQDKYNAISSAKEDVNQRLHVAKAGWEDYRVGPDGQIAKGASDGRSQLKCGCVDGESEEYDESGMPKCKFIHKLRWDLANFYYWSGNFVLDFLFFCCQWHPVLGMWFSHPNHPWTKRDRILMVIIAVAFSIVPSAAIEKSKEKAIEAAEAEYAHTHDILVRNASVNAATVAAATASIMFVTVPNVILGVILYQLAIADTRGYCANLKPCLDGIKHCCLGCTLCFSVTMTVIAYAILMSIHSDLYKALYPLFYGLGISWVTWFPIWFLLPYIGFAHEWYIENNAYIAGMDPADGKQVDIEMEKT